VLVGFESLQIAGRDPGGPGDLVERDPLALAELAEVRTD
jgi:hypothetical protein